MATILIVDDRRADREYLVTLLGSRGHRLIEARDGGEALVSARAERPDLIIADILMPTMDGYELVRQIRADSPIAQTPVVFWTAHYHEQGARALASACGVSIVITKPAEPEAALRAVETALGLSLPDARPPPDEFDREHLRRLRDELSQKADVLTETNGRLSAMIELNLSLGSELDLHRLVQDFGQAARKIIGARHSVTGILDASGSRMQNLYTSGVDAETAAGLGSPDPRKGVLGTVLHDSRSVRMYNPDGDPAALGFSSSCPPVYSWVGAPIASPTRVYGYISLINKVGFDEFSTEDERLATILAAQVGRIYQNGSLYLAALNHTAYLERELLARAPTKESLVERMRQDLLIAEAGASLASADAFLGILRLCAEALIRNLHVPLAQIWIFNGVENVLELKASAGLSTRLDGRHSRVSLDENEIALIHLDNCIGIDSRIDDREWATRVGISAFAGHPLVVDGRLLGAVGVFARQPLGQAAEDVLGAVANEIALGIERSRVIEALRIKVGAARPAPRG